jgi:DNA-binding beta-propeller fold protein YncE
MLRVPTRRLLPATLASLSALGALLMFTASPASAIKAHVFDSSFGEEGSGAGQFKEPSGIAVNEESGNVYVVDTGNARVQQFDGTGTTVLGQFDGAAAPTGPLENPKDIAIDNSGNPLDPSENDLYVSGEVTVSSEVLHVIYKFSEGGTYLGQILTGAGGEPFSVLLGIAVDPVGQLWVFQESREIDNYDNGFENTFLEFRTDPRLTVSEGFAVDSEDNLYVNTGEREFDKLSKTGENLIFRVGLEEGGPAAAVDMSTNDVYVDSFTGVRLFHAVAEPAELVEVFGAENLTEGAGIGVSSSSPDKLVYVADRGADAVKIFRLVVRPTVLTLPPSELGPHKATLNGTVNPEGVAVSSCVFEYDTLEYKAGEGAHGTSIPCEQSPGSGEAPVAVTAKPAGLQPGNTYHYRLIASDENGKGEGGDESFTLGPGIDAESVSEVSADAATFQASIDPHRVATSAFFQYGTSTAYGSSVPVPPQALGEGEGEVQLAPQHVQGLSASTTYHYRVVAIQDGEEFPGPDRTFTTQGPGGELTLPDARAWELVSPPDKHGGVIEPVTGAPGGAVQAAVSGGALSYLANAPTEAAPPGSAGEVQVLSTRGPSGWSSRDIASPHTRTTGKGNLAAPEYRLFSEELSSAVVQPWGLFESGLSEEASEQTPYLRMLGACTNNCYRPLVSAKAGFENALPGFGEERPCEEENGIISETAVICGPRFVGASADLRHVALISPAPLSAGAGREQLYEWSGGSLSQVSLLPANGKGEEPPAPDGTARFGNGFTASSGGSARRAISSDGVRVFWEAQSALYLRDATHHQTLQVDSAEAACLEEVASKCESGGGRFQIASADGQSVLFSDTHPLTKEAGFSDLYECKIVLEGSGKLACELHDLTPESAGQSARVQGSVLGASSDDQTVYFVAEGVLSTNQNAREETASAGQPNLYVRRGGAISFIATLAQRDAKNWSEFAELQPARVSASGQWLAFMSERPLTGYDNRDALSGKPDAEIYEYDAQTGQLSCASCDPSGARPHGVEFQQLQRSENERLVSGQGQWDPSGWVAALTPASPSFSSAQSAHQSRALADSGRLFFNALDSLVPQDVNGNWDVYQREPEGTGNCKAGAPSFEEGKASCLGLISSGASAQESAFLDASEGGGDVFFLTSAQLTRKDFDQNRDVYDAHECTPASPCIPEEALAPPPCGTEASCRPAPSPQPQIFGAPASSTFSGPGNIAPAPPAKGKTAAQIRAEKLKRALKACRAKKNKRKRHRCEKQARNKYEAKVANKPTNKRRTR